MKSVTIIEIEINHFLIAELNVLKILLFPIIKSNDQDPVQRSIYSVFNPQGQGLKFLTRLSHLNEHRFRHTLKTALTHCALAVWK